MTVDVAVQHMSDNLQYKFILKLGGHDCVCTSYLAYMSWWEGREKPLMTHEWLCHFCFGMQKNLACLIVVAHSVRDFPHCKAPVVRADPSSLLWLGARIKECIKLHLHLPLHPCEIVLKHRDYTCVYLCMHVCIMHCTTFVKFVWTCCFISHVIWKCGRLWTKKLWEIKVFMNFGDDGDCDNLHRLIYTNSE